MEVLLVSRERHHLRASTFRKQPPAKRRCRPKTRDLGPGACLWWRSNPTSASPWTGRRGVRARFGLGFGFFLARVARKRVVRDAREQSATARPIAAAAVAAIPLGGRDFILMPRTSCGAPMAFRRVFAGGIRLAAFFTAVERNWNADTVGWHVCQARRPLRRPCSRSFMGKVAGLYGFPTASRRGSGQRPCGWITAPKHIVFGPLHQPDPSSGASSRPKSAFVAEPQTNGVAERIQSHASYRQQITDGRIVSSNIAWSCEDSPSRGRAPNVQTMFWPLCGRRRVTHRSRLTLILKAPLKLVGIGGGTPRSSIRPCILLSPTNLVLPTDTGSPHEALLLR